MLPNASKEEILATGFFRNHKYTEEGGVIPEEYRITYILDKTKTYSKGILGLTAEMSVNRSPQKILSLPSQMKSQKDFSLLSIKKIPVI